MFEAFIVMVVVVPGLFGAALLYNNLVTVPRETEAYLKSMRKINSANKK